MDHNQDDQTNTKNDSDERKEAPLAILNQVHSDMAIAIALQADLENEDEEGEWSESETETDEEEYENEYEFFDSQGMEEEHDEDDDDDMDDDDVEEDEVDPDEMSYEDLVAMGEAVGEERRGMTAEEIKAAGCLRKRKFAELDGDVEMCVICQAEYGEEDEDKVVEIVGCGHAYHEECVTNWLLIRKNCPVCGYEVDPTPAAAAVVVCKDCGSGGGGGGGVGNGDGDCG